LSVNKHWQYLKYVVRHKWFVLVAGLHVGAPLWRLLIHDWSKFLPCEWRPYAAFFYGMPDIDDNVWVDCIDGVGGRAVIIEKRYDPNTKYKVRISDGYIGESQEFWAHDFEVKGVDEAKAAFDAAWNHHQKANPHHWQYWLLTMDSGETAPIDMPEKFVREMVADWIGAGWAIRNQPNYVSACAGAGEWYAKNADRMKLSARTRRRVEELLNAANLVCAGCQ
jgi:hypothetical protein